MFEDNRPKLSEVLLKYRELNHFTQQFVADKIGITRSAYTYYETGKTEPSMETLQLLQKLLGIPTEAFFPEERRRGHLIFSDSAKPIRTSTYETEVITPRTMGELTKDERELIANYRLADPTNKRRARNILDPEYEKLKRKSTQE
ncbi:MAG: helix-turn-helix transcriptional regulator [Ruminococcaceae bacterium]|nr:helix-turn-helix transcriptional regulator [Oscillospiraceae bacterium]